MGAWYPTFKDIRSTPGITTLVFQAGVHTVFLILPIPETSGFAVSVVVYGNVESTRSVDRHVERVDRYVDDPCTKTAFPIILVVFPVAKSTTEMSETQDCQCGESSDR